MAAPDYLYTYQLPIKNSIGEEKVILLTSSSESPATLLARFYLDFFTIVTREDGVKVWAGACYVGSANYYMHNTARHGWTRLKEQSTGREYVVFWDAGLNTLGISDTPTVGPIINIFQFDVNQFYSKSAYYVNGEFGLSFSKDGINWNDYTQEYQQENTIVQSQYYDLGVNRGYPLVATQTIRVRSFHKNIEGTKYSDPVNAYVKAWLIPNPKVIGINSWPSQATQRFGDVYAHEKTWVGSLPMPWGKVSINEDGTGLYDDQVWFVTDDFWFKYSGNSPSTYTITEFGTTTPSGWPIGDPARNTNPPSIKIDYVYYGTTQTEGCIYSNTVVGSLYRTVNAPFIYYTSPDMLITAEGYYSYLETRPNRGNPWNRFINGVLVESGVCPYYGPNQ